jgi:hypothetical protein
VSGTSFEVAGGGVGSWEDQSQGAGSSGQREEEGVVDMEASVSSGEFDLQVEEGSFYSDR